MVRAIVTEVKREGLKYYHGGGPGGPVVKTSPFNVMDAGSTLGQGAVIPHAFWPKSQNIKQKQYCNKFSKDFKYYQVSLHVEVVLTDIWERLLEEASKRKSGVDN